jgi:uncharacterized protein (DUF2235 family)
MTSPSRRRAPRDPLPRAVKRLIVCCDGMWNRADQQSAGEPCPTNVVKLGYRVAKRDGAGVPQVVHYDHGVGTGNSLDRLTGGAFGRGLDEKIHSAYRFLVANYEMATRSSSSASAAARSPPAASPAWCATAGS